MDIPVLQCSFDEHTSSGGVTTRLEAFVDVLLERRKKKSGSEKVQKEA
jgi:predicted nucleotide-binding protein (sugar kinase/HSP70/actin superfamily)